MGVICTSLAAELFRIDRDIFTKLMASNQVVWHTLIDKASNNF